MLRLRIWNLGYRNWFEELGLGFGFMAIIWLRLYNLCEELVTGVKFGRSKQGSKEQGIKVVFRVEKRVTQIYKGSGLAEETKVKTI